MRDRDGGKVPLACYKAVLDDLVPVCTQSRPDIAALADAGHLRLAGNHVTDMTRLTILQHIRAAIQYVGPVDCQAVMTVVVVVRSMRS